MNILDITPPQPPPQRPPAVIAAVHFDPWPFQPKDDTEFETTKDAGWIDADGKLTRNYGGFFVGGRAGGINVLVNLADGTHAWCSLNGLAAYQELSG